MPSGHVDKSKPLRPLSAHAWSTLAYCAGSDSVRRYEGNPGVWDRLSREGLVEFVPDRSGGWMRITDAGREKLKERP